MLYFEPLMWVSTTLHGHFPIFFWLFNWIPGHLFPFQALNLKFSGKITEKSFNPFPEQYFTCGVSCESCELHCELSMGHVTEGKSHSNSKCCRYQHQYENKVYLCKQCYLNGRQIVVKITTQSSNDTSLFGFARYAWSGSVIECSNCGEIHRSRQYWYGNKSPEDFAVR